MSDVLIAIVGGIFIYLLLNRGNSAQNTANIINNNLNKLTGDSSNYSQLNDASASYWDFTVDGTADGHWYTSKNPRRDQFISDNFDCYGSKKFRIQFEISTSLQANTTNSTRFHPVQRHQRHRHNTRFRRNCLDHRKGIPYQFRRD